MRPRSLLRALPVLLVTLGATLPGVSRLDGSARAQTARVADVTALQGPEREPKLVEGAKREKELTFYSAIPPDDIAALAAAFDKRYGIVYVLPETKPLAEVFAGVRDVPRSM